MSYECKTEIYDERGYFVCLETGEVIERVFYDGPERLREDSVPRYSTPLSPLFLKDSLVTTVDSTGDSYRIRRAVKNVVNLDNIYTHVDDLNFIKAIASKLSVQKRVLMEAVEMLKALKEKKRVNICKGREVVLATVLYIAMRNNNHYVTLADFAEVISVPRKYVFKCCEKISEVLRIKVTPMASPEKLLDTLSVRNKRVAAISPSVRRLLELLRNYGGVQNPNSTLSGCLYIMSIYHERKITQKQLSEMLNVTATAIRRAVVRISSIIASHRDVFEKEFPGIHNVVRKFT